MARYLCNFFSVHQGQHATDETRPWHNEQKEIKHTKVDKEHFPQRFHPRTLDETSNSICVFGELFCQLLVNYCRCYLLLFVNLPFTTLPHTVQHGVPIIDFQVCPWNTYHRGSQSKGTSSPGGILWIKLQNLLSVS